MPFFPIDPNDLSDDELGALENFLNQSSRNTATPRRTNLEPARPEPECPYTQEAIDGAMHKIKHGYGTPSELNTLSNFLIDAYEAGYLHGQK